MFVVKQQLQYGAPRHCRQAELGLPEINNAFRMQQVLVIAQIVFFFKECRCRCDNQDGVTRNKDRTSLCTRDTSVCVVAWWNHSELIVSLRLNRTAPRTTEAMFPKARWAWSYITRCMASIRKHRQYRPIRHLLRNPPGISCPQNRR